MGETFRLRETTNPTLSDHMVGIGNIFERELPGQDGLVRERMSASLSIFEPASGDEWDLKVAVGDSVTLGEDVYRVLSIEEGSTGPGWLTLELASP